MMKIPVAFDISYTPCVTYDGSSIAEYLGGELIVRQVDGTTPIDNALRVHEFAVASPTGFATMVIGAPDEFRDLTAQGSRLDALSTCIAVTAGARSDKALDS